MRRLDKLPLQPLLSSFTRFLQGKLHDLTSATTSSSNVRWGSANIFFVYFNCLLQTFVPSLPSLISFLETNSIWIYLLAVSDHWYSQSRRGRISLQQEQPWAPWSSAGNGELIDGRLIHMLSQLTPFLIVFFSPKRWFVHEQSSLFF